MNWSFSNKSSAAGPQFLSFQQQEDVPKAGFDSLASSRLLNMPTTSSFPSKRKPDAAACVQKITGHDGKHARVRYSAKQLDEETMNKKTQTDTAALRSITPRIDTSPVLGSTDSSRKSSKITKDPQLTIFYNGSVFVFDRITPDKVRAILFLAGNDSVVPRRKRAPSVPVQASPNEDGLVASQPSGTSLGHVSRISRDASHPTPRAQVSKDVNASRMSSDVPHRTSTARVSTNEDSVAASQPYGVSPTHIPRVPSNLSQSLIRSRNSNDEKRRTVSLNRISSMPHTLHRSNDEQWRTACLNRVSSMPNTVRRSNDEAKRPRMNPTPVIRNAASSSDTFRMSGNDDDAERPVGILESSWIVSEPLRTTVIEIQSDSATPSPSGCGEPKEPDPSTMR